MQTLRDLSGPKWMSLASSLCVLALVGSSSALGVTVVVTSTADTVTSCSTTGSGELGGAGCTLRDAIIFSNANPQTPPASNLIQFNIPGSGVQTITLLSDLPAVTTATIVDGYSQPGTSPNTLAVGDNAVLLIEVFGSVDSSCAGVQNSCLSINGGTGSVIQGLIINHGFNDGCGATQNVDPDSIELFSCCNRIVGNFVGIDPTGTKSSVGGLYVGSARNQVGGTAPADRNVIEANSLLTGIMVPGGSNTIEGNYIGTNAEGSAGVGGLNAFGVDLSGSSNFIHSNLVSGNASVGIGIEGHNNILSGNLIGTDAGGTLPIPNGDGVLVFGSGNSIGTPPLLSFLAGNTIAFNGGNLGGTGVAIVGGVRNSIRSNAIFSNALLGIDLVVNVSNGFADGVTPNDPCDTDSGANDLQNFPVLTGALVTNGKTVISGTLNSSPNTTYDIQLFANHACDASGFGEGETLVGEVFVTNDSSCNASFQTSVPGELVGQFITATATDPAGNTSEFSECQPVIRLTRTLTRIPIRGPVRVAPGVPVEFPVQVRPPNPNTQGSLSGEVVVFDDAGDTCRADVSPTGEGRCSLTFGAPGHYLVRAQYLGNAIFEESTSPPVPALVGMPGGRP